MRFVWAEGAKKLLTQALQLGWRESLQVEIEEVKPGDTVEGQGRGKGESTDIQVFGRSMVADPSATRSRSMSARAV